nr:hypothetical protein [Palleronia salina]
MVVVAEIRTLSPVEQGTIAKLRSAIADTIAHQSIVAFAPYQSVVVIAAIQQVVILSTVQKIVPIPTEEGVFTIAAGQGVVTDIAIQRILPFLAHHGVIAFSSKDQVVAGPCPHDVVVAAHVAQDRVIRVDTITIGITGVTGVDHVIVFSAFDDTVFAGSIGHLNHLHLGRRRKATRPGVLPDVLRTAGRLILTAMRPAKMSCVVVGEKLPPEQTRFALRSGSAPTSMPDVPQRPIGFPMHLFYQIAPHLLAKRGEILSPPRTTVRNFGVRDEAGPGWDCSVDERSFGAFSVIY